MYLQSYDAEAETTIYIRVTSITIFTISDHS